ncbi:hypothetical protein GW755_01075 [bacterium]|nr:hypothetical protein [bacterium]
MKKSFNNPLILIIPGLGDDSISSIKRIEFATNHFKKQKFKVIVYPVYWRDGKEFKSKLLGLLKQIDLLSKTNEIYLLGTSAGASLALNVFLERRNKIQKVVNVCGRLRTGKHKIRSLENMAKTSIAFKQSVQAFEKREKELSKEDKQKILTIRPFFGDDLVPADTVIIGGALNKVVYVPTHVLGIAYSLKFSKLISNFFK